MRVLALVFNLAGLKLAKYGGYGVHLPLNGHEIQRLAFTVTRPPQTG